MYQMDIKQYINQQASLSFSSEPLKAVKNGEEHPRNQKLNFSKGERNVYIEMS